MAFQNAIASTVTVIAGILVCIVVRLPIGLPPAPWSCPVLLYMWVFWKVDKVSVMVEKKANERWAILSKCNGMKRELTPFFTTANVQLINFYQSQTCSASHNGFTLSHASHVLSCMALSI